MIILSSPGSVAFHLFSYPVYYYGICIAVATLLGFSVSYFLAKKDYLDFDTDILFDVNTGYSLDKIISDSFDYWHRNCLEKHGFQGGCLSDEEVEAMANLLRGDFHFVPSLKESVERTVKELCALTGEQYELLESLLWKINLYNSSSLVSQSTLLISYLFS